MLYTLLKFLLVCCSHALIRSRVLRENGKYIPKQVIIVCSTCTITEYWVYHSAVELELQINHQQILREWSENRSGLWVELVEVELPLIPIDIANTCTHVAKDFVMY